MSTPKKSNLIATYYLLVVVYWLVCYVFNIRDSEVNYAYQFFMGLVPLLGGVGGLLNAKKWGGLRSSLGKALTLLSLGLIAWGLGQMVWSYYVIFTSNSVPFPSFADLGYITAVPLWALGIIGLSKATGAKYGLKKKSRMLGALVLPFILAGASYYFLVVLARGGTLIPSGDNLVKTVLDVGYPLGDVVVLTFAVLIYGLSAGYLGGRYRMAINTLLAGYVVMYFADFSFAYTTTKNTYYNGHWVDLLFPTALAMMAYGLNKMEPTLAAKPQPQTPAQPILPSAGVQDV